MFYNEFVACIRVHSLGHFISSDRVFIFLDLSFIITSVCCDYFCRDCGYRMPDNLRRARPATVQCGCGRLLIIVFIRSVMDIDVVYTSLNNLYTHKIIFRWGYEIFDSHRSTVMHKMDYFNFLSCRYDKRRDTWSS